MPSILLYLSAVLLVASAALGYLNHTHLKEKTAELRKTTSDLNRTVGELGTTKKELKSTGEQLTASKAKVSELEGSLAAAKSEAERLNGQIADFQSQIAARQTEIDQLKSQLAGAGSGGRPGVPGDAEKRLAELQAQVAELSQVKASLDDKLAAAESRVKSLVAAEQRRQAGLMAKGLSGEILAVNQAWNFVVLSLGDRQGVTANAEMIVMRRGAMVGRVKITSVEPSQSIADIVPSSLSPGLAVQPGDRVIYPGS
ncbi:MAG: hypothetical protein JSR82_02810 [Verrucomicrobia bacterium]|nr:hypothetical protein [Verrucomicrobiota bacterium]